MSQTFVKLFSSITESTVWMQPDPIRILWITMLAMADRNGRIFGSIPGLANRARITLKDAEDGIQIFLSPDPYSQTQEKDGRRIEVIPGGWRLINYLKYREIRDVEERRVYQREWAAEKRKQKTGKAVDNVDNVDTCRPESTNAEAEAEEENINTPNGEGGCGGNSPAAQAPAVSRSKPKTSVPANFVVTDAMRTWALSSVPDVDIDSQTRIFLEHHQSVNSKFSDWTAAWRKWMHKDQEWKQSRPGSAPRAEAAAQAKHEEFKAQSREEWKALEAKAAADAKKPKPTPELIERLKRETVL